MTFFFSHEGQLVSDQETEEIYIITVVQSLFADFIGFVSLIHTLLFFHKQQRGFSTTSVWVSALPRCSLQTTRGGQ